MLHQAMLFTRILRVEAIAATPRARRYKSSELRTLTNTGERSKLRCTMQHSATVVEGVT